MNEIFLLKTDTWFCSTKMIMEVTLKLSQRLFLLWTKM